jgi:uncharacterized protein YbjT (DUF2867 family)
MRIAVVGATGLVGTPAVSALQQGGHVAVPFIEQKTGLRGDHPRPSAPYDRRPRIVVNHSVDIRRVRHTVTSTKRLRFGGRDE